LEAIVLAERLKQSGEPLSAKDQKIVATANTCLLENVRGQVKQILDSFAASASR
jgi:hypothetical protein